MASRGSTLSSLSPILKDCTCGFIQGLYLNGMAGDDWGLHGIRVSLGVRLAASLVRVYLEKPSLAVWMATDAKEVIR